MGILPCLAFVVIIHTVKYTQTWSSRYCSRTRWTRTLYATPLDFDFSSAWGWETAYASQQSSLHNDASSNMITEWHASIPLSTIASYVSTVAGTADFNTNRDTQSASFQDCTSNASSLFPLRNVLLIGCGHSKLPDVLLYHDEHVHMTLLDSSPTCMHQLQERYTREFPQWNDRISYVVGDATRLSHHIYSWDVIVDKGLMDALLCGEGWETSVERLLRESFASLRQQPPQQQQQQVARNGKHSTPCYLLIGYKLPPSTRAFVQDVATSCGWVWEFGLPGSNNSVEISMARPSCTPTR
jgi:Methyltransferase domain